MLILKNCGLKERFLFSTCPHEIGIYLSMGLNLNKYKDIFLIFFKYFTYVIKFWIVLNVELIFSIILYDDFVKCQQHQEYLLSVNSIQNMGANDMILIIFIHLSFMDTYMDCLGKNI